MPTLDRPTAVLGQPVRDPAEWTSVDLQKDQRWLFRLDTGQIEDLQLMAKAVRARIGDDPNGLLGLGKEAFDLGSFAPALRMIRFELKDGLGLALIRGLPIDEMARLDAAIVYWGIGRHLGEARSNNADGDMLGHVTDLGKTQVDLNTRGYQTSEGMEHHCDQCSIVGLLCVRDAQSGGISRVASSVAVYNEMLGRSPSSVEVLSKPFHWTKHGQVDEGQKPFYTSPVFSFLEGKLCSSFGSSHIIKGHNLPGAPRLTEEQRHALTLAEQIAEEQHYEMELERGDIQLLNNYVALHTRTAYKDWPDPSRKRLLYRLWLSVPDLRPATAYVSEWDAGIMLNKTRQRIVL